MKREEGNRGDQEKKRVAQKEKERQIKAVIGSLSVLLSPEHTHIFTVLGREEKVEGRDGDDLHLAVGLILTASSHLGR